MFHFCLYAPLNKEASDWHSIGFAVYRDKSQKGLSKLVNARVQK